MPPAFIDTALATGRPDTLAALRALLEQTQDEGRRVASVTGRLARRGPVFPAAGSVQRQPRVDAAAADARGDPAPAAGVDEPARHPVEPAGPIPASAGRAAPSTASRLDSTICRRLASARSGSARLQAAGARRQLSRLRHPGLPRRRSALRHARRSRRAGRATRTRAACASSSTSSSITPATTGSTSRPARGRRAFNEPPYRHFPDFYGNPHNPDTSGWRLAWRDEHQQGVDRRRATALGRTTRCFRASRDPAWYARAGAGGLGEGEIDDPHAEHKRTDFFALKTSRSTRRAR